MSTFTVTTNLIVGLLSVAGAWGAAETPPPQKQAPGIPSSPTQVPQIGQGAPLLKHFGVGTPVVGSNNTLGLVQLVRPAGPPGVNIKLTSSHPAIVKVPDTVIVMRSLSDQSFQVSTVAVAEPTSVTISAQVMGGETKTVTVIVQPPKLSIFTCSPSSIPVGIQTTCTAWLDGEAPADAVVTTTAPDYGYSIFPYIKVPKGKRNGSRQLIGQNPGPQPRAVTVYASFGGVSKSTPLTVGPAYLKSVTGVFSFNDVEGAIAFVRVELYAPAPGGGLPYRLELHPPLLKFPNQAEGHRIPAGRVSTGDYSGFFNLKSVPTDTLVTIVVITNFQGANDAKSTKIAVSPARLVRFGPPGFPQVFTVQDVPLSGASVKLEAWLEGHAPAGAVIALSYSSSSLVTGPATVTFPKTRRPRTSG